MSTATIQEKFEEEKIDLDILEEVFDNGTSYGESSLNFITEVWARKASTLSIAQTKWADKILDDCIEHRIARKARA